jgi:septal ring factor EnvC (AmiA/AmiB activator)
VILPSTSTQSSPNPTHFNPDFAVHLYNVPRKFRDNNPFVPRTGLRRFLWVALCCLTLANVAFASQQEELDNLRKRIAAVQRNMDKTSESKTEAADSLRESERAISTSNRKLAEISSQQHTADQKLGKLQGQLRNLNSDIAVQQTLLGKLLYQQYLGGKQEYLKLLLNSQDPNQIARNLQYYQYIARERATWLATLRRNLSALDTLSISTREQREKLVSLRTEQSAQKTCAGKNFSPSALATPRDYTSATRREPSFTAGQPTD